MNEAALNQGVVGGVSRWIATSAWTSRCLSTGDSLLSLIATMVCHSCYAQVTVDRPYRHGSFYASFCSQSHPTLLSSCFCSSKPYSRWFLHPTVTVTIMHSATSAIHQICRTTITSNATLHSPAASNIAKSSYPT